MSKKPSWHFKNKPQLEKLCEAEGYELFWLDEYHARVLSGVCIVDIWTPRMKYNVLNIEGVEQPPKYGQLEQQFNPKKVNKLLVEGRV